MPIYKPNENLTYVEKPEDMGLRYVGRVFPESNGGRGTWDTRGHTGWHTDPYGYTLKDGTGLMFGVVYQLPARHGHTRFVAGYQEGGADGGPVLDLGIIYESKEISNDAPQDHDGAREAARAADYLAQREAEKEREYQTAWQLGHIWAEAGEEIAEARREVMELLKERRVAKQRSDTNLPAICRAIRKSVEQLLGTIEKARKIRLLALEGNGPDYLCVYMSSEMKAAFCEGAGISKFPG